MKTNSNNKIKQETSKTSSIQTTLHLQIQGALRLDLRISLFVFTQKQYPENFTFLTLRTLKLFICEVCVFL